MSMRNRFYLYLQSLPAWECGLKFDGVAVTFEGECGYIPHYHAEGKEYYLYPVYKSWCDGKD